MHPNIRLGWSFAAAALLARGPVVLAVVALLLAHEPAVLDVIALLLAREPAARAVVASLLVQRAAGLPTTGTRNLIFVWTS